MPDIGSIRQQFPQYGDMSDEQLAGALHQKFYSDMPVGDFADKIGLSKGAKFDLVAGRGAKGVGKTAVAAGEDALSMASGVAGDIAGAATSIVTQDPKKGETVRKDLTYQPKTEAGKAGQEYIGELAKPLTSALNKPVEALEKSGHPILAQAARAAEDVAPIPGMKGLSEAREAVRPAAEAVARAGEERAATAAAQEAPKLDAMKTARSIGLKLEPEGKAGKVLEGVGGKIQTQQGLSRANAKTINRTAGKEIGLTDKQPLTAGNISREKAKAISVYDKVKQAGPIAADDKFKEDLDAVKDRSALEASDYPEDTNDLIDKEIKKFDKPSANASSMVEKIKKLRERAGRNMSALDSDKFELGLAQKKIATSMEDLIERVHPDKSLISDFRQARQKLAKIYNVEEALGPSGNLSAAVLARQLKRGVPLSGGLKSIAEAYQEFPKVMQYVDRLGGDTPFSALDFLVGGVEAAARPEKAASIVGALAGRPIARGIIRSEAFQKRNLPSETRPSVTSRVARRVAGPKGKNTIKDLPKERREPTLGDE